MYDNWFEILILGPLVQLVTTTWWWSLMFIGIFLLALIAHVTFVKGGKS